MSWSSTSDSKQNQSEGEEMVIGKYEIFIDLKKAKQNQENFENSKNFLNNLNKKDITSPWSTEQHSDLFSFLSDDDSDFGQKYFGSALSDLTNLNENNSKQCTGNDSLFSEELKHEEDSPEFSCLSEPTTENINVEGIASSTAHYIKYLNRNGKLIKVWECGICSRNFQHQYTLMRHLPTHTNVRNFVCTECGKAFRQLSTLSQHRAIHSVERPYACETCNKSFNRISTLISHRKTHSDVKPFRCHMCNKGFHQKGNLRNHIYIHTNERPYRCSLCNKGFNQMSNLVCHTQKSHSAELGSVWSCHRCNMSFSKRTLLRAHELETHHIQSASSRSNKTKALYSRKNTMGIPDNAISQGSTDVTVTQSQISENGILIPTIETDAMKTAKANNEIPFAVLHFIEGLPLLVRIIDYCNQSLLRPANSEDFAALKKQQKNSQEKISVPVVAAVYQTLSATGRPEFTVMSPKNIYKFSNTQQMLSINMDNENVPIVPTAITAPSSEAPSTGLSNELMDLSRMEIPPLFEQLNSLKREPLNPDDTDIFLNDIVELSGAPSPKSSIEEPPKAIAIVEDNSWLKQNKTENTEETETFSEAFQNIATGNLLTPKRATEVENTFPDQSTFGFDINNFGYFPQVNPNESQFDCADTDMLSNFLNNAITDDVDVSLLRSLMSDNQKLMSEFDNYFTELLQN